jgi:hypothetical protein
MFKRAFSSVQKRLDFVCFDRVLASAVEPCTSGAVWSMTGRPDARTLHPIVSQTAPAAVALRLGAESQISAEKSLERGRTDVDGFAPRECFVVERAAPLDIAINTAVRRNRGLRRFTVDSLRRPSIRQGPAARKRWAPEDRRITALRAFGGR